MGAHQEQHPVVAAREGTIEGSAENGPDDGTSGSVGVQQGQSLKSAWALLHCFVPEVGTESGEKIVGRLWADSALFVSRV